MEVNSKCGGKSKRTHRHKNSSDTLTYDSSVTKWLNPTTEQDVSATVTITHKLQAKRFHWVRHTHAVIDPVCVRVRRAGAGRPQATQQTLKTVSYRRCCGGDLGSESALLRCCWFLFKTLATLSVPCLEREDRACTMGNHWPAEEVSGEEQEVCVSSLED